MLVDAVAAWHAIIAPAASRGLLVGSRGGRANASRGLRVAPQSVLSMASGMPALVTALSAMNEASAVMMGGAELSFRLAAA